MYNAIFTRCSVFEEIKFENLPNTRLLSTYLIKQVQIFSWKLGFEKEDVPKLKYMFNFDFYVLFSWNEIFNERILFFSSRLIFFM